MKWEDCYNRECVSPVDRILKPEGLTEVKQLLQGHLLNELQKLD
jgi:hypothetical protein